MNFNKEVKHIIFAITTKNVKGCNTVGLVCCCYLSFSRSLTIIDPGNWRLSEKQYLSALFLFKSLVCLSALQVIKLKNLCKLQFKNVELTQRWQYVWFIISFHFFIWVF